MKSASIRPAVVSGSFYPKDPQQLRGLIDRFLSAAQKTRHSPKALIAPHAGYVYSGPVAARAYVSLENRKAPVERVVLVGPSHRVAFNGLALCGASYYSTPLGRIPIDVEAQKLLMNLQGVIISDEAHAYEHSLEVHLPFLQRILGEFKLIPLVAGNAPANQVAELVDCLWGGDETLIVISTDLSHYHDYATACRLDSATSHAIEACAWRELDFESACGRVPLSGLLYSAKARNMSAITLDLRNSGDTAGSRDRVVGYGAYLLH